MTMKTFHQVRNVLLCMTKYYDSFTCVVHTLIKTILVVCDIFSRVNMFFSCLSRFVSKITLHLITSLQFGWSCFYLVSGKLYFWSNYISALLVSEFVQRRTPIWSCWFRFSDHNSEGLHFFCLTTRPVHLILLDVFMPVIIDVVRKYSGSKHNASFFLYCIYLI
jgi:hypothetical protein